MAEGGFFTKLFGGAISIISTLTYVGAIASAIKAITYGGGEFTFDTKIFDNVVEQFQGICLGGMSGGHGLMANTQVYAGGLMERLMTLDLLFAVIFGLLAFENAPNFLSLYANKIIKYGFWSWVVIHWPDFCNKIVQSLEKVGNFKGGSEFISEHPSKIVDLGITYGQNYIITVYEKSNKGYDLNVVFILVTALLVGIVIFLAFYVMAVNLVLTKVEFFISSSLMLIFIPFALFDKTERFASQSFNLVISCGTRLMVLSVLCTIAHDLFKGEHSVMSNLYLYKDQADIVNALMGMSMAALFAYLCCQIPQVASGIISGSLQLNSDSAFMHQAGAFGAIYGGGQALKKAGNAVTGLADDGAYLAGKAAKAVYSVGSSVVNKVGGPGGIFGGTPPRNPNGYWGVPSAGSTQVLTGGGNGKNNGGGASGSSGNASNANNSNNNNSNGHP